MNFDPMPGGGTYSFSPADWVSPVINQADDVAFTASGGVFLNEGDLQVTFPLALTGWLAPGTGGGTFNLIDQPSINENGDVAFWATINGGTGGSGIFLVPASSAPAVGPAGRLALAGAVLLVSFALLRLRRSSRRVPDG